MTYVTVSLSGGKDSTAMVLHMIELGEHIDEVVNVDTGMEFPAMYDHLAKVRRIVEDAGIRYTVLKAEYSFEQLMTEKVVHSKKWGDYHGYGWPSMVIRWCTRHLKLDLMERYFRDLAKREDLIQCIGLASDEFKRLERAHNQQEGHRHPLVEWGWTEADCLTYCKSRGFDWGGLYDLFDRVSCWCCPMQGVGELRKLWANYPDLWAELERLDRKLAEARAGDGKIVSVKFRHDYSVEDLRIKFEREAQAEKNQTTLLSFGGGGALSKGAMA